MATEAVKPTIEVCYGPECSDCGSREMGDRLKALGYTVVDGDCRDQCPNAPMVLVDNRMITDASMEKILNRIESL